MLGLRLEVVPEKAEVLRLEEVVLDLEEVFHMRLASVEVNQIHDLEGMCHSRSLQVVASEEMVCDLVRKGVEGQVCCTVGG